MIEKMDKDLNLEDLQLYCRTCLCVVSEQRHSFQEMPETLLKLLSYAGLKITQKELLPDTMCSHCYDIIKGFDDFCMELQRSTQCLDELLRLAQAKSNSSLDADEQLNNLVHIEENFKKLEPADPLQENEDFEPRLIKLEMLETSSEEDVTNKEDDELISTDPIVANDVDTINEDLEQITKSNTKNQSEQIVCKYGCGRKFRRTHNAEAHYRFKHKDMENEVHTAEDCELKNIKTELTEIGAKKTTCNICFKSFTTLNGLRSHMCTHGEVRPFQCDQCNRGFNMKARLKRHIRETHEANPPEIPCKFGCGKTFIRHESAMNHYRVKHILPEKGIVPKTNTYICEDCGKTFKTMHNLKEHSYIHRPTEDRPFQCEQCQKRFISKRPYEIHLLRHAGIKNFECKICGLKTTTHSELRNHMNHHTKAKQVNCPICSKTYTNPDNLRRHTLIVHQGVKNYKCRFCDEKFGKPDHLKHHEMRHTGEKPHKCQICDRAFIQLVALKTHMKTHNKVNKLTEKEII